MKVLITGGTGSLGSVLVGTIMTAGHAIRILSRRPRPHLAPTSIGMSEIEWDAVEWAQADIASSDGIQKTMSQVDVVLHAASDPRHAQAVDVEGTKHLVEAARQAGVAHFIYISIVGIDEIPLGYYQQKLVAENIIRSSRVPYSILRATQFHSLVDMLLLKVSRIPVVMPLPTDLKFQSVAEKEVAERLTRCLADGPSGGVHAFGGPEVLSLGQMAQTWMEIRDVRKKVLHLPAPGAVAAGFRAGKNTTSEGERGVSSWREWLTRYS